MNRRGLSCTRWRESRVDPKAVACCAVNLVFWMLFVVTFGGGHVG